MSKTIRITPGSTSQSVVVNFFKDDGKAASTLLHNTSGMAAYYRRDNGAEVTITLKTLASITATHDAGGFLNIRGCRFRFDLPDAAIATGASRVEIIFAESTDINPEPLTILLDAIPTVSSGNVSIADGHLTSAKFSGVFPTGFNLLQLQLVEGVYYVKDNPNGVSLTASAVTSIANAVPQAATIRDAILDRQTSQHTTAGSVGKAIADGATSGGGATAAEVWAYTARTLTGGSYTYTGPVDPNTNAAGFVAGDAVPLSWTVSTTDYPTIQNGDATKLRFIPMSRYKRAGGSAAAELEVDGTASISGSTITLSFSLTGTQTDDLATVYPADNAPTHQIQVKVPTRSKTPVEAEATIRRNIEGPT
jgi:hypothetical protein